MKRIFVTLAVLATLSLLLASVSLACGAGCSACAGCVSAPAKCTTSWSATAAHAVSTSVAAAARAVKSVVKAAPQLVTEFRRHAASHSGDARLAIRDANGKFEDVVHKVSSEVRSLSLSSLHSAFSALWGLLSGLLRS